LLDYEELEYIIDKAKEKLEQKIIFANREGNLEKFLVELGLDEINNTDNYYETYKTGKIVIIGESRVKKKELEGIIKSLKLDVDRFEFCLDYTDAKKYDYKKLQYNPRYRLVIFGPVPHSSSGKSDSSSVIANFKKSDGFPRTEVLSSNSEVKITKTNIKSLLIKLIEEEYI
jgi:hypothetical protein